MTDDQLKLDPAVKVLADSINRKWTAAERRKRSKWATKRASVTQVAVKELRTPERPDSE